VADIVPKVFLAFCRAPVLESDTALSLPFQERLEGRPSD
jgi:hypothetical protein